MTLGKAVGSGGQSVEGWCGVVWRGKRGRLGVGEELEYGGKLGGVKRAHNDNDGV